MNMKRGMLWLSLLAAWCAAMAPLSETRAAEATVDGISWSYSAGVDGAILTGANPAEGHLSVPSTLGGLDVVKIGYRAFSSCENLVSVTIPGSVRDIGDRAFQYCSGLELVTIAPGVTNIGAQAFQYCEKLTVMALPQGVAGIGTEAFFHCSALTKLYAPAAWEGSSKVTDAGVATNCTVVYGEMSPQVVFNANGGGCSSSSRTYVAGTAYGQFPEAWRSLYALDGWYTEASGGDRVDGSDVALALETRTLYAHWRLAQQQVTFNGNGGQCATNKKTYNLGGTYGWLPDATRAQYSLEGWYTGEGVRIDESSMVTESESLTLYAHWTLAEQLVTFNGNGGVCDTDTRLYAIGKAYGWLPDATRPQYALAGWYTTETGGDRIAKTNTVTASETRTLHAQWTLVEQSVAFDANGGRCTEDSRIYTIGEPYSSLPEPERDGYAFAGWFTVLDGDYRVSETNVVTASETRTLHAAWTLLEQVVTFEANGGICKTASQTYKVGTTYGSLPKATRKGYAFTGWVAWTGTRWERILESSIVTEQRTRWMCALWNAPDGAPTEVAGYAKDETGLFRVHCIGESGKMYALQRTQKLGDDASWETVASALADLDGEFEMTAQPPEWWGSGFYRVVEVSAMTGMYLVVDMGGGRAAATWPVSELDDLPAGGWTDEYKTTKLVLRRIAPESGVFMMGSPAGELGRDDDEILHEVTLTKPYYIGVFEMTQQQWELAMGTHIEVDPGAMRPVACVSYNDIRGPSVGARWPASSAVDEGSFLHVLRAKTGLTFDLPTEAQWENACRAGTRTALNTDMDLTDRTLCGNLSRTGRYFGNQTDGNGGYTAAHTTVGSYMPNAWGLHDMHGNAFEWCLDWYGAYPSEGLRNPVGPESGTSRVLRGGDWNSDAQDCRSAFRSSDFSSHGYYGFRVVCPVERVVVFEPVTPTAWNETVPLIASSGFANDGSSVAFSVVSGSGTIENGVLTFTAPGPVLVSASLLDHEGQVLVTTTQTVTAARTTATINIDDKVQHYDGTPKSVTVTTEPEGLPVAVTYDGKTDLPTEPGAYAVHAEVDEPGCEGAADGTLVIVAAGRYLVVDLSGGTSVALFPTTILDSVPEGGWTDEYKTTKMVLRWIDAGTFTMGSPTNELGHWNNESLHEETLTNGYWIGVFEVTQKQWELVMGDNPSWFKGAMRPVEMVSHERVVGSDDLEDFGDYWFCGFMEALSWKTGMAFGLPTESQWEYACRAGSLTALNSGCNLSSVKKSSKLAELGRYRYNKNDEKGGYTQAHTTVGSYLPNAWGLYDMHGNVFEFCSSLYTIGGGDREYRRIMMHRGGSWYHDAQSCRSANRSHYAQSANKSYTTGFRCVCYADTISYRYLRPYAVTIDAEISGGSIRANRVVCYSPEWFIVKLTVVPESGMELVPGSLTINGNPIEDPLTVFGDPIDGYSFVMPEENVLVSAKFRPVLPPPDGLSNDMVASSSFSANWDSVPGATSYCLDVSRMDPKLVLSEDFHMCTATHYYYTWRIYTSTSGWESWKCFHHAGAVRLGSSMYESCWLSTPALNLQHGGWIEFDLRRYKHDKTPVTVSYSTGGGKWVPIQNVFSPKKTTRIRVAIPDASDETKIRIESTGKRAVIDNLAVYSYGVSDVLSEQAVDGTSFVVEGLEPGTYSWRVRAVGNARGVYSRRMDVVLSPPAGTERQEQTISWTPIGQQTGSDRVPLVATASSGLNVEFTVEDGPGIIQDNVLSFTGTGIVTVRATQPGDAVWEPATVLQEVEVAKWPAVVKLSGKQVYWEGERIVPPTVETEPAGLPVVITYDGNTRLPTKPGKYTVTATVEDDFYEGSATNMLSIVQRGAYLVVDMAGGLEEPQWPVTYLETLPENGWGDEFKTTKLLLRRIEPGTFTMGSPTNELGRAEDETQHEVILTQPYYIGVFEITQKQWDLVMGSNSSYYRGETLPVDMITYGAVRGTVLGTNWPSSGETDPDSFMGIIRKKTGLAFDLPTEAQWEYACRAGTTTALNSGKDLTGTDSCPNASEVGLCNARGPTTVGCYLPNAWDLYDMHGNVWEICLDWYGSYDVLTIVSDPPGPATGTERVLRGGSWYNPARRCRSATRNTTAPLTKYTNVGLRLCCPELSP